MAQRKLFAAVLNQVQQLGRTGAVVQVAAVAGNTHFEIIRIRPTVQAERVVVGFQRNQAATGKVFLHDRS